MKGTTVVLVVLNSYVHYGEDLEPIDELEKKIKKIFSRVENVRVIFLISNEKVAINLDERNDAIAFYYPRQESLYHACKMGVPVLNYDGKADDFKFVSLHSDGLIREISPINVVEILDKMANTNK